jgi:GT2 family glycosyltransferase
MSGRLRASIVVPVRDRADLLASALKSLAAQDFPDADYEIIVCDDGSHEDIGAAVQRLSCRSPAMRVARQPPLGPAAARNLGIRLARAPIVIFIDSDVVADSRLVASLVGALDARSDWLGAEAALHPLGDDDGILWDAPSSAEGGHYHTAAIAYRRDALWEAGGFDEEFRLPACEDVELAVRVLARGTIGFVPAAKVWHPRRRVTRSTHWRWRHHWRYETILAVRYGILAFPGRPCGAYPRLRVAAAALATLPAGRLLAALSAWRKSPRSALLAACYAVLDVVCGLWVLPSILFAPVPLRRHYLAQDEAAMPAAADRVQA